MFGSLLKKKVFRVAALLLVLWGAPTANGVLAHVDSVAMPDPVAEMEYRILLEFQPDDHASRNKLGMVLLRLGQLDEALKEFSFVLDKEPANFDALDGAGVVLQGKGDHAAAVERLEQAAEVNPQDRQVHLHLGDSRSALLECEAADQAYRDGLALMNPEDRDGLPEKYMARLKALAEKCSPKTGK